MSDTVHTVTDLPKASRSVKLKTLAGAAVVIATAVIAVKVRSSLQSDSPEIATETSAA